MGIKIYLPIIVAIVLFSACDPDTGNGNIPAIDSLVDSLVVSEIRINTVNNAPVSSKDEYIHCSVEVISDNKTWNYSGEAMIRGRGNSTWLWYNKKPYRIKLNQKSGLMGLKADKDWVLLANFRDPTHLMNTFAFTVGRDLGLPFTNRTRYAELTLNGDYKGLYQVTEQIKQGINRVNIDSEKGILISLDADDGPYHSPNAGDNFWSAVYNMPVCVKHPSDVGQNQITEIKNELKILENAIKSADYVAVAKLLDIPVFIDFLIIQELVYNVELAAPRSMYLHRNSNGKWIFGPLWDFDAGFDFDWATMYTGHNYFADYKELVLGTDPLNHKNGYRVPSFFTDLFRNKQFVIEYKKRWNEIKENIMKEYWATTMLYAGKNDDAMKRNAARWPINKSYQTEILRMEQWLKNRTEYLTTVISNYPAGSK